MLSYLPNEIIYKIIDHCSETSRKNIKLTCKFCYIIIKDFEYKKLITISKEALVGGKENIIYKLCIKHYLYPYSFDLSKITKMDKLFLELKLRFFIMNTSINTMSKSFEIFYNTLIRFNKT